ncbi:MAG: hypothetical protein AAFN07_13390 [Pseudomonadota bacterium]
MVAVAPTTTVRARLSDATGDVHESLHVHPLSLALLNQPTPTIVRATMTAARRFYAALESARDARGCWDVLQLSPHLDALQNDLGSEHLDTNPVALALDSDAAILGALYVAHGAQFGRQQIRGQMLRRGLDAIPAYYTMSVDRTTWHALLDALEVTGTSADGFDALYQGAMAAFTAYRQSLDLATPYKHRNVHSPS